MKNPFPRLLESRGFALVVTLSLMILLTLIAVGLLSLSAVSLRGSSQGSAQAEAQANARLALMIALGELQKEMGPDMRVSAESALFDSIKETDEIDGVKQSHWLASYDAWGDWLNATYTPPGKPSTSIGNTYNPGRVYYNDSGRQKGMLRRWLLSLPAGDETNLDAPNSLPSPSDPNWVKLVGKGSLGFDEEEHSQEEAEKLHMVTRAYLANVVKNGQTTGKYAWWVGGENQKARVDKAKRQRSLSNSQWEVAQGDTAEVGVGKLSGFSALDANQTIGDKLITFGTTRLADVQDSDLKLHFHDITVRSQGVLASVRTGRLKKDLSLLFEKDKASLPNGSLPDDPVNYRYSSGDVREPSIRPMSPEIIEKPALVDSNGKATRHFASWTRMRHFYRMYRQDSDAEARSLANGGTDGSAALTWTGSKPSTNCNSPINNSAWWGQDTYYRTPIITNITYILSLKTQFNAKDGKHTLRYVASPVYELWNPYNVEMRLPDNKLKTPSYLVQVQPLFGKFYLNGALNREFVLDFPNDTVRFRSGTGNDIVFKPGEFRIFSPKEASLVGVNGQGGNILDVEPPDPIKGFWPCGGLLNAMYNNDVNTTYTDTQEPRFEITFCSDVRPAGLLPNSRYGNTPGSFVFLGMWETTLLPFNIAIDWLNTSPAQVYAPITTPGTPVKWIFDDALLPVGYIQVSLKGIRDRIANNDYPTIAWARDWRCRNWIQAPPFYPGKGLYMSDDDIIGNTQRIDCPYDVSFGPLGGAGKGVQDIIKHVGSSAFLGHDERVTAAACLELPTAPLSSLAGFSGMRIDPGWTDIGTLNPEWKPGSAPLGNPDTSRNSLYYAASKAWAYQSGITGPGIGNSFLHPVIPRTEVYQKFDNSKSKESLNFRAPAATYNTTDTKAYCDYWDHVLLLNDALWDDYFVSSLADQKSPGETARASLADNLQKLASGGELANSRYKPYLGRLTANEVKAELDAAEGYLKAASYLTVDGMFNVNSTSVAAWHALFAGIRERQVVYRDKDGTLRQVAIPSDRRIAISRFNTATTDQESTDPEFGFNRDDAMKAWSDVRFLSDAQLLKLAEECVKQVKRRGPFLNFSEFINRRLSNDDLGTMGALQSAIDYDDANPEAGSINFDFKREPDYRIDRTQLGQNAFATPEAAVGSRFAGIPGYVIQSDLLKPIANTLSVRDDTFRIRSYGDSRDKNGYIVARAWCEAIIQRVPEYCDAANKPEIPARKTSSSGEFTRIEDSALTPANLLFGRKFRIESFRWLDSSEI